jgi:F-type H+-transporting ATPase subunit delta
MVNETLARRYATAIFNLAQERGAVDRVSDDLTAIATVIPPNSKAHAFFVAPVIDRPDKERLLRGVFENALDEISLHSLLLLVRKRRESLLHAIVVEYAKLRLAARDAEPLRVTSARQLSSDELAALVQRLEALYKKKFEVTQVVDPELIGGMRILMGDRRIDGTVSGRLEALARELFATN